MEEGEMVVGITGSVDMNLGKTLDRVGTGRPGVSQSMGLLRVGRDLVTEPQQHHCSIILITQICFSIHLLVGI